MNIDKDFLKQAYEKYRVGDSITDEELMVLHRYFKALDITLSSLYIPKYHLMANDVYYNLNRIDGYIKARKELE